MGKKEDPILRSLQQGLQHHQQGNLRQAEVCYNRALRSDPANPNALHLLGVLALQSGKYKTAAGLIKRAISGYPDHPEFHNNLGNALGKLNQAQDAIQCYRNALRLDPGFSEAYCNLGLALVEIEKWDEGLAFLKQALDIAPSNPALHFNIGMVLRDRNDLPAAEAYIREALRLNPGYAEAHNGLGSVLKLGGRKAEAMACYQEAIRLNPNLAEAHCNKGVELKEDEKLDEAFECFREALRLNPDLYDAHLNLGALFQAQGNMETAIQHYDHAIRIRPEAFPSRWLRCLSRIKIIYDSPEDVADCREQYRNELLELPKWLSLNSMKDIHAAAKLVGNAQTFFLAYQGESDREFQCRYGEMVHRIQTAGFPEYRERPEMPPLAHGESVRVGIVSGYFRYHSNWKIPIKGWVEQLDRTRFALYGYHTGKMKDAETERARRCFERFYEGLDTVEEWAALIRRERLHLLIFPELGMDTMALRLAALWLAPIQCTSWGHPETSGLPTIDYYLSSDLMEPENGQDHYSERLVRLPNLSIYYTPPDLAAAPGSRSLFGLRDSSPVFFCAQSLFKYLPRYDDLFARIALETGDCQFAFISFGKSEEVTRRFRARVEKAFRQRGMDPERHMVLLPQLTPPQYKSMNYLSDVFLDSAGWSGCNSTLEAIESHLPVVTLPGNLMRGRHSSAILSLLGATETIARSEDEFVALAARLARDSEWRGEISRKYAREKHRLYRDMESIRGLQDFIDRTVRTHAVPAGMEGCASVPGS